MLKSRLLYTLLNQNSLIIYEKQIHFMAVLVLLDNNNKKTQLMQR